MKLTTGGTGSIDFVLDPENPDKADATGRFARNTRTATLTKVTDAAQVAALKTQMPSGLAKCN